MLCECAQDIVSGVRLCGSSMMFVAGVIVRLVEWKGRIICRLPEET